MSYQLLAVHSQGAGHVVCHPADAGGALVHGQVAQAGAEGGQRVRTQALGVGQDLITLIASAEALLALRCTSLLGPAQQQQ